MLLLEGPEAVSFQPSSGCSFHYLGRKNLLKTGRSRAVLEEIVHVPFYVFYNVVAAG